MRHRVFGVDEESGERLEIVVEAESIAEAEAKAGRRGLRALRVEAEDDIDAPARRRADAEEGAFADAPQARSRAGDDATAGNGEGEQALWSGGPSQWTNVWRYAVALLVMAALIGGTVLVTRSVSDKSVYWPALLAGALLPMGYIGFVWLRTALVNIDVTSERLRERNGIILRTMEEIELFRVKDMEQRQSLAQRLVGLGTLVLHTSDTTRPTMVLNSIRGHRQLHDVLRKQVERLRRDRGVREFDMNDAG